MNKKDIIDSLYDRYECFVSREALAKIVEENLALGFSTTTILVRLHLYLADLFLNKELDFVEMMLRFNCQSKRELLDMLDTTIDELSEFHDSLPD